MLLTDGKVARIVDDLRRAVDVAVPVLMMIACIEERTEMRREFLLMIQRHDDVVVRVVRPCGLIAARELRRTRQMRHLARSEIKSNARRACILFGMHIAHEEIRRRFRRALIQIDKERLPIHLLVLYRRLPVLIRRRDAHAVAVVPAKAVADIDRLLDGLAAEVGDLRLDRITLGTLGDVVDRPRRCLIDRSTAHADIRPCDHTDTIHPVKRQIHLSEHPRHTVGIARMTVDAEAADGNILIEVTRLHTHGRIQGKRPVHPVRRCRKSIKRLAADLRHGERYVHHRLFPQQTDGRLCTHKSTGQCLLLLLRRSRTLPLHLNRCELVGVHLRCLFRSARRAHPHRADSRQGNRKRQLSFRHVHFLLAAHGHMRPYVPNHTHFPLHRAPPNRGASPRASPRYAVSPAERQRRMMKFT